jgi:hypothetical protein
MRYQAMVVTAFLAVASTAAAQQSPLPKAGPEIRPVVGAYVPLANQADNFKSAVLVGGQLAFEMSNNFHILGSFGWVPQTVKFTGLSTDGADIYQYDAGVEFNLVRHLNARWYWRPFAGLGAGGRTYHYAAAGVGSRTCTAGYGTLGSEFQRGIYALRFEARDNVSCFESPIAGLKKTNNDLTFSIGLAYHIRWR